MITAPLAGRVARLLQIAGVNAIPLGGVLAGGWHISTAILTYWFETVVGTAFVLLRMYAHRRLTRKKGYWYASTQDESGTRTAGRGRRRAAYVPVRHNYVAGFATTVGVFTLAHGLVLALVIVAGLKQGPAWETFGYAVLGVLAFQAMGLAADLVGIADRPFAWMHAITHHYLGRVALIQLSIIGGVFAGAYAERPVAFFAVFGVLKLVADIGSWLPRQDGGLPDAPPRWMVAVLARTEPEADPVAEWDALRTIDREKRALWEEPMPHP